MVQVLASSWALLLGMLLLMVGNGIQGTLLGIRGGIEGFSTFEMSLVMSAYFVGFLGGSRLAPGLIRRVGHIRVFAALASLISAVLILYPALAHPISWTIGRVLIGFCFSAVYVTAESWLNNSVTNETRGQALSLYMIVQMAGIVSAQGLLLVADPGGFILFIIPSVLVSISFAPILLSVSPTPAFETTKPMSLRELVRISPTGAVGMFLMGGVYSALFGMASVFGTEAGMSVAEISGFIAAIYIGGLLFQFPIGWLSDRMDRRTLIVAAAATGGAASAAAMAVGGSFAALAVAGMLVGGMSNPLYALLIAYTNDYLDREDMAAASGGMLFINGVGAIIGPILTGWMMGVIGPQGFFLFVSILMLSLAAYAAYRMTQRAAVPVDETAPYAPVLPTASPVAVEVAQEVAIENAEEAADDASPSPPNP
ncbi:putative MFS family arabinose efflux permease [Rhodovulum bhavnagarense]|uniref:Putative MFS family arabinose efflux permease n=1 Tax=Rhodovulum bhavnagarense TaxID=992286 RepID=A0A4R2RKF5_9RHOB|nr:MFS transporter [Rhodovulum bhavnagarense]TCP63288.1 putative MFS family arabinose efflux permease [Rhodovulum bhavnagarense]